MRVALLASARSVHTRKIANSLAQCGHAVFVFSLLDHRDAANDLDPQVTVRYFRFRGKKSYFCNHLQLRRWVSELEIDVVNAHYASGYGMIAALANNHPYALSVWGSDVYDFPTVFWKRYLLRFNLSRADAIFSTSHSMAAQTATYAPGREITVTPFGVDTDLFKPSSRSVSSEAVIRIGFIKRLAAMYGPEYLIRAFSIVCAELPEINVELRLYGGGVLEEEMRALARSLRIDHRVVFYGKIPHASVPEALHEIDIFCVTSLSESFGVAVVEAMACGVPCITSDASGFAEVMVDGVTGFVVPRQNERAVANAIMTLVHDPELRLQMGKAARTHVMNTYRWADNFRVIENALERLVPDPN